MGTCLPYAIGAAIANPDKTIIAIDGDGSFNMTLNDLRTIKRYNINNIKICLMNDGWASMVRVWEELFFNARYTATNLQDNPDYVMLTKAFGLNTV